MRPRWRRASPASWIGSARRGWPQRERVCGRPEYSENCPQKCPQDRKSTRLNSSHLVISYAVFCLKKKNINQRGDCEVELASLTACHPFGSDVPRERARAGASTNRDVTSS